MGNNDFFKALLDKINPPSLEVEGWEALQRRLDRKEKRRRFLLIPVYTISAFAAIAVIGNMIWSVSQKTGNRSDNNTASTSHAAISQQTPHAATQPTSEKHNNTSANNSANNHTQKITKTQTAQEEYIMSQNISGQNNFPDNIHNQQAPAASDIPLISDDNIRIVHDGTGVMQHDTLLLSEERFKFSFHANPVTITELPAFHSTLKQFPTAALIFENSPEPVKRRRKPLPPNGIGFYLDIAAGMHHVAHDIKGLNNNSSYISRRNNEEHDIYSISPRVQAGYLAPGGLNISAGFEYFSYGELVQYNPYSLQTNYFNRITQRYDSVKIFNLKTRSNYWKIDTAVFISPDSTRTMQYNEKLAAFQGVNTISYFEIPLSIGYQRSVRAYSIGLYASASLGILNMAQSKGYYLSENGQSLVSFSEQKNNFSSLVCNYAMRLRLGRTITRKWFVYIEPAYKSNISPVFSNGAVQQRYHTSASCYFGFSYFLK